MNIKVKVGDRVRWGKYKGYGTGIVEKIVPEDLKPIKVRPDAKYSNFRRTLAALKEGKCTILKRAKSKKKVN